MNLMSPKDIYKEVLKETGAVVYTLETQSESVELSRAIETARNSFVQLKSETDNILQEFDKNAEWDVLTIAFYGETNAGKSTIIETLRILMGERTKQEQQQKFRQICEEFNIDEHIDETLKQKKQEIEQYEENLKSVTSTFVESQAERKMLENELVSRAERLAAQIKAMPFWRRGLSFVWKIPEKEELNTTNEELSTFVAETRRHSQEQEQKESKIIAKIDSAKKKVSDIDIAMKELESHQDGAIISDGQSDFTRESTSYEFTANGNKFVLLDMPGIEGKEELVRESIMQAVRKAHAVFYVTRKADPPQKGDEENGVKGTLEKIKEHLGSQTEVWTIFNKSIKSAEQLRTPQLVSKGELDSLNILEDEMRKQLGENYAGSLSVSAHPAFVASTDHFLSSNAKIKDRRKFLNIMDAAGILQKTGVQSLADKIGSDMTENTKAKIRKSNFNKANEAVLQLIERVSDLNKNNFLPLLEHLDEQARASILQLESATDALKSNVESAGTLLFRKTRDKIRKSIYKKIDSNIGNADFKGYLEDDIQAGVEEIQNDLPSVIEKQIEPFQEEVKDIANQFQEHVQEFIDDASMAGNMDFKLNIKIDNGVNVGALIITVIGAVVLAFVSAGWALVFGILGSVVSVAKAIRKFFDNDYKKAQQRKATDDNIDKIFHRVKSSYISQLEEKNQILEENMTHIKNKFQLPAQQTEQITSSLRNAVRRLKLVSQKIINESEL
jgi:hypothetical protein